VRDACSRDRDLSIASSALVADQAGRVPLLNGAPSSGKTTIARALWGRLEPPHWYRSLDDFRKGYLERHWDAARGPWSGPEGRPLFRMLVAGYLGSLRAMALAGHSVISESVILPSNLELYLRAFEGIPVFLVGVRCPLDIAEERERARATTERYRGEPIDLRVPEFDLVHAHGAYDLEVDTSRSSVDQAVGAIRSALETAGAGGSAFDALRRRTV
jgi:chloramphenicol 3-O phosphotransferase